MKESATIRQDRRPSSSPVELIIADGSDKGNPLERAVDGFGQGQEANRCHLSLCLFYEERQSTAWEGSRKQSLLSLSLPFTTS